MAKDRGEVVVTRRRSPMAVAYGGEGSGGFNLGIAGMVYEDEKITHLIGGSGGGHAAIGTGNSGGGGGHGHEVTGDFSWMQMHHFGDRGFG